MIPASSVISDEKLSKEQIDALLSDNLYATCIVEKYLYNYIIYNKESYVFSHVRVMPRFSTLTLYVTWAFNGTTEHYTNDLQQFTIDDNNTVRKIIGYRSSVNKNDSGFNYLYNIESSKYIDLSQVKLLDTEKMLAPYNTERVRDELDSDYYRLDFLDLVYTGNLEGDDVFEKYYITGLRKDYILDNISYALGWSDIEIDNLSEYEVKRNEKISQDKSIQSKQSILAEDIASSEEIHNIQEDELAYDDEDEEYYDEDDYPQGKKKSKLRFLWILLIPILLVAGYFGYKLLSDPGDVSVSNIEFSEKYELQNDIKLMQ